VPKDDPLPFWAIDVTGWITDTAGLNAAEYRALHLLMCHAWRRDAVLPTDEESLRRLLGLLPHELDDIWPAIRTWFTSSADGGSMTPPGLQRELTRALELRDKKRKGARIANERRWGSRSDSVSLSESERDALSDSQRASNSDSTSDSDSLTTHPSPHPSLSPESQSPPSTLEGMQGEPISSPHSEVIEEKSVSQKPVTAKPTRTVTRSDIARLVSLGFTDLHEQARQLRVSTEDIESVTRMQ